MDSVKRDRANFFYSYNMIFDLPLSEHAKLTYLCLCRLVDSEAKAFPSHRLLCEKTGIKSKTTVKAALRELMRAGLLAAAPQHTDAGKQMSNLYIIYNEPQQELIKKYTESNDMDNGAPGETGEMEAEGVSTCPLSFDDPLRGSGDDRWGVSTRPPRGSGDDPKGIPINRTTHTKDFLPLPPRAKIAAEEEEDRPAPKANEERAKPMPPARNVSSPTPTAPAAPADTTVPKAAAAPNVPVVKGKPAASVLSAASAVPEMPAARADSAADDADTLTAIAAYNELCPSLPRVKGPTLGRVIAVHVALNSLGGMDKLRELFRMAESKPFLCGKNKTGWLASFDWLLDMEHAVKVLEDYYWDRKDETNLGAYHSENGPNFDVDEYIRYSLEKLNG